MGRPYRPATGAREGGREGHVCCTSLRRCGVVLNSAVIDSDPVAYLAQLKQEGSGDILLAGGIETTRSLFLAGVVDALTLTIHPVATPQGRRLFDESVPLTRLRLIDSAITSAGNAVLTYALRN